ncbi:MAG: hypothetical protein GX100_04990 [candidate division WS1 bacterium]|nr:hypothetical protein [candidate division WS1 bacterium]
MSKLILETIQPELRRRATYPRAFTWRQRRYRVIQAGGTWKKAGRWWRGEGEQQFVRVLTDRNLIADLCFDPRHQRWLMYQIHD